MSGNTDNGFEQEVQGTRKNAPRLNNVLVALTPTFAIASGGSNISEITIQWQDGKGNNVAFAVLTEVWLSDDAAGIGLTSTSASGTVTAKSSSGVDFGALTAKKALVAQSLATGVFILEITDTAKTAFIVATKCPFTGQTFVSAALATADYG